MPFKDPIKRRTYAKAWRDSHQEYRRVYNKTYSVEYRKQDKERARCRTKQWEARKECNRIKNAAKDRPCADCHIKYPFYVMDFDHVPERGVKLFNISTFHQGQVEKLKAEIAKCDVVCANCHRERTWGRGRGDSSTG
jgi:hypothetical protein